MPGEDAMDPMFTDRVETIEWAVPATQLVAHAGSTCRIFRGEAARGR